MKPVLLLITLFSITICRAQTTFITGTYCNDGFFSNKTRVIFNGEDSTFEYTSAGHPVFFFDRENFHEKGKWTISGDTIILNPQVAVKPAIETALKEETIAGDTGITLTFIHVKRYFDRNDNPAIFDTVKINQLDFVFNTFEKKNVRRVSEHGTVRCAFAGFIPKEIITNERTVIAPRPYGELKSIFIGCYESQGFRELPISNPQSTRLTYTVYSNYYLNSATFRQAKMLIKNGFYLYTKQKPDGKFYKDSFWSGPTDFKLKRI